MRSLMVLMLLCAAELAVGQVSRGVGDSPWEQGTTRPGSGQVDVVGVVLLEQGVRPREPVPVSVTCMGRSGTVALTDRAGVYRFRFQPSMNRDGICTLSAHLRGFESTRVSMPSLSGVEGTVQVGRIVLSDGGPGVVSVTSADAPKSARKRLEKGRKLAAKKEPDLEGALAELRAAVEEYPRYAEAWLELGGVLGRLERRVEALDAYGKGIDVDPRFVSIYRPAILYARRAEALDLAHVWCEEGVRLDSSLRDACEALE